MAAFEKDFWQSNGEKQGGQNGTSSLDVCADAVAALDEQFMGMAVETATYVLESEGATNSLCTISSRVAQAISAVCPELLARKDDVSEWGLQQAPKCSGKLLQALLSAVSLMDMFMKMQPPVNFTEGLLLPHFFCESFRYVHLKDHDPCNWADVRALAWRTQLPMAAVRTERLATSCWARS